MLQSNLWNDKYAHTPFQRHKAGIDCGFFFALQFLPPRKLQAHLSIRGQLARSVHLASRHNIRQFFCLSSLKLPAARIFPQPNQVITWPDVMTIRAVAVSLPATMVSFSSFKKLPNSATDNSHMPSHSHSCSAPPQAPQSTTPLSIFFTSPPSLQRRNVLTNRYCD